MKISILPFAFAASVLWAAAVLCCAAANHIWPAYGEGFLHLVASIYPGYHANGSITSMLIGTFYALFDGAGAGAALAWLYNSFLRLGGTHAPQR